MFFLLNPNRSLGLAWILFFRRVDFVWLLMSNSELLRIKNGQKTPCKKTKDCKQSGKRYIKLPNDRLGLTFRWCLAEALNSASMCYGEWVHQRACSLKYPFAVTQQAIGLQNIIGCFQCFRLKFVIFVIFVFKNILLRMVNPCLSVSIRVPKTFIRGRK